MKENKLILFDWGNIVESHTTGYSCPKAFDDLYKACGYTGENGIFELLSKYKLSMRADEEFESIYDQMAKDFDFKVSYDYFKKVYKEIFDKIDYYPDVAEYERSLGTRCYIGILSNLTPFDKERLDKQVNLDKYDYSFLSFEMRCRKPDREIYEKIMKVVPFEPKDILFIDDKQVNLDTAKEFGWNTFRATGLELDNIKACCEAFLEGN